MSFETLRTERLQLRVPRIDDIDALVARRNDVDVAALQSWQTPYPESSARSVIERSIEMDGPESDSWWMLTIASPDDSEIYGDLALKLEWDGRAGEVGYTLARAHWGHGYAVEAVDRLLSWLFDEQGVTRVHGTMHPDNLRSARVLERCGFEFEGHTRNSFWVGDENSDDWHYGLTPEQWRSWNDRPTGPPDVVELVEPYPIGLRKVVELGVHKSQDHLVAPIAHSLSQVAVPPFEEGFDGSDPTHPRVSPWPRIILADGEPAGFVMVEEPTEANPEPYLWRLLVDRRHQGRNIGFRVMEAVLEQARAWGAASLLVSYVEGYGSPKPFYERVGFVPTGEVDDGETIARLVL